MKCILCDRSKKGNTQFFVCEDCEKFSEIIDMIWTDVNEKFDKLDTIDPELDHIFRLLSDSVFITSHNPQVAIFYKMSTVFVESAFKSIPILTEGELNRKLRTMRSLTDALKVFEGLGLIRIELDEYQRVIILDDKIKKVALSIQGSDRLDEQLIKRISQSFAGYVLLYLLYRMSKIREISGIYELPYKQKFRTLWVTLMFLWTKAFEGKESFQEKDLSKFLSQRHISSASLLPMLLNIDPRRLTGILKDVRKEGSDRIYFFSEYILREMERLREVERERVETR